MARLEPSKDGKNKLKGRPSPKGMLGKKHTIDTRENISTSRWGGNKAEEHAAAMIGSGNYNAKRWCIENVETGEEQVISCLKTFCFEHGLGYTYATTRNGRDYKGWRITRIQ